MGVVDTQYEDLLARILETGSNKTDRTGTGTRSLFGAQLRYNLADSFPLITTKRVFMRGVAEELFWFLSGTSNVRPLQEKNVHIWDDWADKEGELG
ncbi:thymidylate synthase, partial [Varibaculum cambriense]|uniref:thymidylate synthase n=1 Tax=Varibaculum cambriense TaxID=184870 RepID=UPI00255448AE